MSDFNDILKGLTKKHKLPIGALSEVTKEVVGLTTGNLAIDHITGVGGIPVGRITELYGQPSSGKTTTALQAAANLQRRIIADERGDKILYMDFEKALDLDYAADLGLDVEHPSFVTVQPNWLEEGADIGEALIGTGKVRLSIWDSVAKMNARDSEFGARTNAMDRARLLKGLLERLVSVVDANDCAAIFLNHMTEGIQMGGRPGMPPPETSPGGKSLKYLSSLRIAYKQTKNVKGKILDHLTGGLIEADVATHVKVKVTKNKVGPPFRICEVRVRYGQGFDNFWSAMQVLVAHKAVTTTTTGHIYFDASAPAHPDMPVNKQHRPSLHGEAKLLEFADSHPQWRDDVIEHARKLVEEFGGDALAGSPDTDMDEPGELIVSNTALEDLQ